MTKGDIITIIGISPWMAHTTKTEYKYSGIYNGVSACTENKKGARKKFHTPNYTHGEKDQLTFLNLPFKVQVAGDIERPTANGMTICQFSANACLNIHGTVEEVRDLIGTHNLNENFRAFDQVFAIDRDTDEATAVYPEVPTGHAVVLKERAKQTA